MDRRSLPTLRRHALAMCILLAAIVTACGQSDQIGTAAHSVTRKARVAGSPQPRLRDGSLGDENTKRACTLLTPAEIAAVFSGRVEDGTPIYPYCQWLVGDRAFVALHIDPTTPIDRTHAVTEVRYDVPGVGDGAFIASNRALYFGKNGVTYWILWQLVGDFSTVERDRLVALANDVLAKVST